jgi:replicative DNA helicase
MKMIELKEMDVSGEMFLIEANRYIYYSIDYLFSKQQEPSPIAIMEVLKDKRAKKVLEDFGGIEYLTILAEQKVNENNLDIFVQKLKQSYTRYKLCGICDTSKDFLLSDKTEVLNPTEIINVVESKLTDLSNAVQQTKDIYKMGDDAEKILAQRAENPNSVPGLEVGWSKFDYYTNGGQPGDLIMICARAKTGKSTILTNWATKLSIQDKIPVLYFDTEMNSRQQEDRILAILSGVPHKEIVSGMYVLDTENGKATDKKRALHEAVQKLKKGNYYHVYLPAFTMDKVNAIAKKFKLQYGIQAIFFDYLKMPASQIASLKNAAEWQMLGFITSGLKDLAGTLNLPIYSACQENRSNINSDKKDETNVGGSDRILQLASKLIFLVNKSDEDIIKEGMINGNQRLYISFQRNGESDVPPINVKFDRPRNTMYEV